MGGGMHWLRLDVQKHDGNTDANLESVTAGLKGEEASARNRCFFFSSRREQLSWFIKQKERAKPQMISLTDKRLKSAHDPRRRAKRTCLESSPSARRENYL